MRRFIRLLAPVLLLFSSVACAVLLSPVAAHAPSSGTPAAEAPGELLRWEPVGDLNGHPMWRIMYRSTGLDGSPTHVTGIVAVPNAPAPPEGFPLLAIGHPTAGLGRQCAPSLLLYEGSSPMADLYEQTLAPYLDAGFALVMTDYQGLGAPGEPSYLVGEVEGKNILDAILAVRQLPEGSLSGTTLLTGHSQGGHAVAFALQLAGDYAPEIAIDGAVLAAPALDMTGIFENITSGDEASDDLSLVLMTMASWAAAYPEASLDQVTNPAGQELIETQIADACLIEAGLAASGVPPSDLIRPDAAAAWADLAVRNTPAPGPWEAPVLIVQGVEDEVIPAALNAAFADRLCASGTVIEYRDYPATDHFGVLATAVSDMRGWLLDRVAGLPAPTSCNQA
jgi:alpha-beta hydrolase superfamily lysophospholipase